MSLTLENLEVASKQNAETAKRAQGVKVARTAVRCMEVWNGVCIGVRAAQGAMTPTRLTGELSTMDLEETAAKLAR